MENKATIGKKSLETENEKKIQMLKFCIISNFRTQFWRNNLMMFTLDNNN